MGLRTTEWINLAAFGWFALLGLRIRRLDVARRKKILAIGAGGIAITLSVSLVLPQLTTAGAASIVRDWMPIFLLAMFYWQGGQFVTRTDTGIENRLEGLDLKLVAPLFDGCLRSPFRDWIFTCLEIGYLSYYLVMPSGVVCLYLLRLRNQVDLFWTAVLLASYGSCTTLPFLNLRPPRFLDENWSATIPRGKLRDFNLWILRRGSIHANTCPSAPAAIGMACAFVMLRLAPLWLGLMFLWIAVSIALGAVGGRYHYGIDAVLGIAAAVAGFLLACGA